MGGDDDVDEGVDGRVKGILGGPTSKTSVFLGHHSNARTTFFLGRREYIHIV